MSSGRISNNYYNDFRGHNHAGPSMDGNGRQRGDALKQHNATRALRTQVLQIVSHHTQGQVQQG